MAGEPPQRGESRGTILAVHIRRLGIEELVRVVEIDVSERDNVIVTQHGTELAETAEEWERPARTAAAWAAQVADWVTILGSGGTGLGAFADARMVGLAILRPELEPGVAQLAALFVDRSHRRQGVAAALCNELEQLARAEGARMLYVSATESRSAVGFYRSRGFVPTATPHPDLLALEPLDIHMIKPL